MANMHGRNKRSRSTMQYIDSQVDISDEEPSQKIFSRSTIHIGETIETQFDTPITDQTLLPPIRPSIVPKNKTRDSERLQLQRRMSDVTLNRLISDANKTTTEFKGRSHVLRVMNTSKTTTTTAKPTTTIVQNNKILQEMLAKRQEKREINKPISDFALKYGLVDNTGKKSKSRNTSEQFTDMAEQLENLKATLTRRNPVDYEGPLLRVVKLESVCNHLLCYCQYVTDQEDIVLFLDPTDEQSKNLAINDEIRVGGESRHDLHLPEFGDVAMGVTDVRKESKSNDNEEIPIEKVQSFENQCSCKNCPCRSRIDRVPLPVFDLLATYPEQESEQSIEVAYESFTLGLVSRSKFNLLAKILNYVHDTIHNTHVFIARDSVGNCLQITLTHLNDFPLDHNVNYVFHDIEYVEQIETPEKSDRWPCLEHPPPGKLFCFLSTNNQVSVL